MQVSKTDFLTLEEKHQLQQEIDRIKTILKKMPAPNGNLVAACLDNPSQHFKDIDSEGELLLEILTEENNRQFHRQFQQISLSIFDIIRQAELQYQSQGSLIFLKDAINETVNRIMDGHGFDLRLSETNLSGSSLWERLHESTAQIITGVYGYMVKYYEIAYNEETQIRSVEQQMEQFRTAWGESRKKLNSIYGMSEKRNSQEQVSEEEESFIDKMNESKVEITLNDEEQNLDSILKVIQLQQQQANLQAEQLHQGNIIEAQNAKPSGFLAYVKNKSAGVFRTIGGLIKSNQPYEQKGLQGVDASSLHSYLTNLEHHFELTEQENEQMLQFAQLDRKALQYNLVQAFTDMELSIIKYSLHEPIQIWERESLYIIGDNQLTVDNINLVIGCYETLSSVVNDFTPMDRNGDMKVYSREPMFMLLHLFHICLIDRYCPLIKRYLMSVCNILQKEIFEVNTTNVYLRGALKTIEKTSINPTKFASKLARLRPTRSEHYDQSHLSSKVKNNGQLVDSITQDLQNYLRIIQIEQGWNKEQIPELAIQRMNYSQQTKTVNFAISGFLSQDTAKDIEWMGLIRALPDSELYGVTWKSSTVKEMGTYIGRLCGQGLLNPIGYSFGLVGKIGTIANVGYKIYSEYKNNPFAEAHQRADITGRYLAQLIIAHFSDRFVNLIGFSLGTEVIFSCLRRLAERNRLGLINRVVTMGGVVCQDKIKQFLQQITTPLSWMNLTSSKDHTVKYLYRFYSLGVRPIGAAGLPSCVGHHLHNLEVGSFVQGHMDFRCYLYGITHITELIHD